MTYKYGHPIFCALFVEENQAESFFNEQRGGLLQGCTKL